MIGRFLPVLRGHSYPRMYPRIARESHADSTTEGASDGEPLRHMLAGAWSRRISEEHRLVYLVDGDDLVILQARFHYK
jgi:Txe/YoeB family toxin of toxin-antitoxin system